MFEMICANCLNSSLTDMVKKMLQPQNKNYRHSHILREKSSGLCLHWNAVMVANTPSFLLNQLSKDWLS